MKEELDTKAILENLLKAIDLSERGAKTDVVHLTPESVYIQPITLPPAVFFIKQIEVKEESGE